MTSRQSFPAEFRALGDTASLLNPHPPRLISNLSKIVEKGTSGGVSMGKTLADFYRVNKQPANMKVALEVRARRFLELFLERMETWMRSGLGQEVTSRE